MTKKLQVGIIDAGWPGQQHARAISAGKTAILNALAEPNEQRAVKFSQTFAPKKVYQDYGDLLGDRRVDAVVICLPNHLHSLRHSPRSAPGSMCFVKNRPL